MDVALEKKLGAYKQIAIEKLETILLTIFGRKDLVVEPEMIRILDSFANMTWLKSKGFDKIFRLSSTAPPKTKTLVFMIFADLVTFKHVLDQIRALSASTPSPELDAIKDFHVIVVPHVLATFRYLLESEGLSGLVRLHRFAWDFIRVDQSLLLLEIPDTFRQVYVQRDTSALGAIASSLRVFNVVHRRPRVVFACGSHAEKVVEMVARMEDARKRNASTCSSGENEDRVADFSAMLVLDRDVDYASCLLTPVTYSALMLELYDAKAGILSIEGENRISGHKLDVLRDDKREPPDEQADVKTLRMCGTSDEFYTVNKHNHFADVVNVIKAESRKLEAERQKYSRTMNVEQMRDFVEQNLPKVAAHKKVLGKHLVLCERIVHEMGRSFERRQSVEELIVRNENRRQVLAFVDECLATDAHEFNVLRLVALFHVCNGVGLTGDELQRIAASFLNVFGHRHLHVFHNLHRARLLPDLLRPETKKLLSLASTLTKKSPFMSDVARLSLVPSTEGEEAVSSGKQKATKACPSYVFNGNFIPMVAQLANFILRAESFADLGEKVGSFELKAKTNGELKRLRDISGDAGKVFPLRPKTLFVFVVGGISYAEVAACKIVESLTGSTIVLASDEVTSGANLIRSAM